MSFYKGIMKKWFRDCDTIDWYWFSSFSYVLHIRIFQEVFLQIQIKSKRQIATSFYCFVRYLCIFANCYSRRKIFSYFRLLLNMQELGYKYKKPIISFIMDPLMLLVKLWKSMGCLDFIEDFCQHGAEKP